jgi:hypothetical protein
VVSDKSSSIRERRFMPLNSGMGLMDGKKNHVDSKKTSASPLQIQSAPQTNPYPLGTSPLDISHPLETENITPPQPTLGLNPRSNPVLIKRGGLSQLPAWQENHWDMALKPRTPELPTYFDFLQGSRESMIQPDPTPTFLPSAQPSESQRPVTLSFSAPQKNSSGTEYKRSHSAASWLFDICTTLCVLVITGLSQLLFPFKNLSFFSVDGFWQSKLHLPPTPDLASHFHSETLLGVMIAILIVILMRLFCILCFRSTPGGILLGMKARRGVLGRLELIFSEVLTCFGLLSPLYFLFSPSKIPGVWWAKWE